MPAAIPGNYIGFIDYANPGPTTSDPAAQTNPSNRQVIDGTPARVAALGVVAVATLVGLKWAGFRFNVAVGN